MMRVWRTTHPLAPDQRVKNTCRRILNVVVKRGKVQRGPCAICGRMDPVEAHHRDYQLPYFVVWLCRGHHLDVTQGFVEAPPSVMVR
jgi:hypothetical protein